MKELPVPHRDLGDGGEPARPGHRVHRLEERPVAADEHDRRLPRSAASAARSVDVARSLRYGSLVHDVSFRQVSFDLREGQGFLAAFGLAMMTMSDGYYRRRAWRNRAGGSLPTRAGSLPSADNPAEPLIRSAPMENHDGSPEAGQHPRERILNVPNLLSGLPLAFPVSLYFAIRGDERTARGTRSRAAT